MTADMRIRKNVLSSIAAFAITSIMTFVGFKIILNTGGLELLGLWSALNSLVFFIRLGDVGVSATIERLIAASERPFSALAARRILDTGVIFNFAFFSLLGFIAFPTISWILPNFIDNQGAISQIDDALPIVITSFVAMGIAGTVISGLRGLHLGYLGAWLSAIGSVIQLGSLYFLTPKFGIAGIAASQLIQHIAVFFAACFIFGRALRKIDRHYQKITLKFDFSALRNIADSSMRVQAANMINNLFEPVAKILVGYSTDLATLGVFEIAYKAVQVPRNAIVSGTLSTAPALANLILTNPGDARALYYKTRAMTFSATIFALTLVSVSSPLISSFILNEIRWDFCIFTFILSLGFALNVYGAAAYILGFASGKVAGNAISGLASLCFLLAGYELVSLFREPSLIVVVVAISFSCGGLLVKILNEKYVLPRTRSRY